MSKQNLPYTFIPLGLLDLGVKEGLFAGGSGDVQYYDAESKTLCVAAERIKPADKKWVLRAGQTERGLTCIGKLVRRHAPSAY